jgi:FAD:protein FMN transferase
MNTIGTRISRRSLLKLPALLPLIAVDSALGCGTHHFQYEYVIGTSMDLSVWTTHSPVAETACRTILAEIDRLASILDRRDPGSEISVFDKSNGERKPSRELAEVLDAYNDWERRTGGVFALRPDGVDGPRNVDALGKAYIIDRAARAARDECPSIDGLILNIGGDIVAWGRPCEIDIADPSAWYDNAPAIASVRLQNAAIATSGTYARGAHLREPRSGRFPMNAAATVVASDPVTANALATTLCLMQPKFGLQLVESTPGAEALHISSGVLQRSSGFAFLERGVSRQTPAPTTWPPGYRLTVTLPLTAGKSKKRPYVAVWVEDASGNLVRTLAFWGTNSKYHPHLSRAWNVMRGNPKQFRSVTRATRPAGKYELVWDGTDNENRPVPLGTYRITVETNQEHGTYARQTGTITLGDSAASITLPATTNFDSVFIQYGPK